MENGQLALFDPATMLQRGTQCSSEECVDLHLTHAIEMVLGMLIWLGLAPIPSSTSYFA